ncbi:MAG: LysM peptidoglycan-binding domain-containing protein, partial [Geminicoccaceae bacterium]
MTQHLGVPGDHKFMIDKKRKVKIENEALGNVQNFDVDKKKKSFFKKLIDVAVPVIGTVLTFVPGAQAIGMGINAAYSAYKGAEAIKHGDLLGGALSIAGAFAGGAANAFSGAAARTAANVANGINVASQGVDTARALKEGDMFGALAGGLGTAAMMGGGRNFQVAAGGVKTTQSLAEGDFLGAGAGFTGVVGNLSRPGQDPGMNAQQAQHTDTSFAFSTLSDGLNVVDGIQEGNFAQIGKGLAGGIKGIGDQIDAKQSLADTKPLDQGDEGVTNAGAATNANGERETVIRQAGFTKPNATPAQSVEVAGGDTLSRIATRHGTSVDALMAANPSISDPSLIHAGQELTLPEGVRSVGADQQQRLSDFGNVNGGSGHLPSPRRPDLPQHHPLSPSEGATAIADAEFDASLQVYQREFDQAVDTELSSVDRQIADIDRQLAEGVNHAPVEYHLKNERLKLQAQRRDVQALADNPNAAFDVLNKQSDGATSEFTHFMLDVAGLAPGIGDVVDAYHASLYASEGRHWDAGMTAAGIAFGPAATVSKWGIQLGKAADGAALDAADKLDGVTTNALD